MYLADQYLAHLQFDYYVFCRSPFPVTVCSVVFCHETARIIDHLCRVSVASAIAVNGMMQTVVLLVYVG